MQNQAPALRHFSQFSIQDPAHAGIFVTHHASNDDTLKALQDKDFSDF